MRLPGCSNNHLSYCRCILIACLLLNNSDAKRHRHEEETEKEGKKGKDGPDAQTDIVPYQSCGTHRICDRRIQYCDEVVGDCASCADDCHPARILGDAVATNECRVLCRLYYKQMTTSTGIHGHDIAVVADGDDNDDDDVVARTTNDDDDDDDDDATCMGSLSRRELRLLIQLELLKSQSRTAMEIMFCAIILIIFVIGFIWLRSFDSKGHPKTRDFAEGHHSIVK